MADSDKLRIIAILEEIKKHESFFQNPLQNSTYKGFLIEYNLMENFIKKISFEELKNFSSINFSRLKEKLDFNKINNYIISKKFGSKQDLVNELKPYIRTVVEEWVYDERTHTKFKFYVDSQENIDEITEKDPHLLYIGTETWEDDDLSNFVRPDDRPLSTDV